MPELPEVETMRRGIRCCVGCRITAVQRPRCRLKPITIKPGLAQLRRRLVGRTIQGTERVGKRVVVRLDNDDRLVFEPRMTGLVLVADPPNDEHLRFRLRLESDVPVNRAAIARTLLFWDRRGLGSVRLFTDEQFEAEFGNGRLGPDALKITADQYREQLGKSSRAVKVALLDQQAVAGIGNLYASEILHVARINPGARCDRLKARQWQRLEDATREVLKQAIRYEGSTLNDGTYRNAQNRKGRYQNHHRVYNHAGDRCETCGRGKIQRQVQAQRSTFFCPVCQRAPRR